MVAEEHPKSASFTTPWEISRFVGLMSLWMKRRPCRKESPARMSSVYRRMSGSGNGPAQVE